jgi:poly-gamma-glutamate capsule biosynthesis protein CapA/YwtB (metallophosphatase superfamily)
MKKGLLWAVFGSCLFVLIIVNFIAIDCGITAKSETNYSTKNVKNSDKSIRIKATSTGAATIIKTGNAATTGKTANTANAMNQAFAKTSGETSIIVSAAGDCVLGGDETFTYRGSFIEKFNLVKKDYSYFLKDVKPIFQEDDLSFVNLETTLTTATKKMEKEIRFKGLPEFSNILKTGNVDVVNLANNHIHDYLNAGYRDTISNVKKAGVGLYGDEIVYGKTVNGVKVCFLGYRVWEDSKYIRNKIKRNIEYYKSKDYNVIIISFHWGVEWTNIPIKLQQDIGRLALDSGANLVIGHHPHVMQSIEKYKGKYIVYSLGNFCYGGIENPTDRDSFIFQQKFVLDNNGNISTNSKARVIPCLITTAKTGNDYKPAPAKGTDKTRILNRLGNYSKTFSVSIDRNGMLK